MKNADMPAMPNELHKNGAMNGLTKREYFAGLAMQGLLASDTSEMLDQNNCVKLAVDHADALIAELERAK